MRITEALLRLSLATMALAAGAGATAGEPELPVYRANAALEGSLCFGVEDGLGNATRAWAEGFSDACPRVSVEVEGWVGVRAALDLLSKGTYDLLPFSRELRTEEVERFRKTAGHEPTAVRVALRATPVLVAADNPIADLTLAQLDAMFSTTRKRGAEKDLVTWGDLGLTEAWAERKIELFGRERWLLVSGEFRETVLAGGEFKPTVVVVPGNTSIAEVLARSPGGVGYDRPGSAATGARAVRLVGEDGKAHDPTDANVQAGRYPLVRPLLVYVNRVPGEPVRPVVREFVKFLLSKQGQDLMGKGGFVSVGPAPAVKERAKVE